MPVKSNNPMQYAPAYVITNEDWRWARAQTPQVTDVLTVAGSGDQALSYLLTGAKNVDTFDVSKCAGIIQDIKTTAMRLMPRDEYYWFMEELHYVWNPLECDRLVKMMDFLPQNTQNELRNNNQKIRFNCGLGPDAWPKNQFTRLEYGRLQNMADRRIKFIDTDIKYLGVCLNKRYDLIDLSNIFDFNRSQTERDCILANLIPYIKVGGRIIMLPQSDTRNYKGLKIMSGRGEMLEHEKTLTPTLHNKMVMLQRTR